MISGIFVISTLAIEAELLHAANISIETGDNGLVDLSDVLAAKYGPVVGHLFLLGFWAASFSSVLGSWNGVSMMFADFWGRVRSKSENHPDRRPGGKYYKFYVLWITFPPMLLLLLGKPVAIIITYGVLGSLFMPFLAITLLLPLNGRQMPPEWRNGWVLNAILAVVTLLFLALGVNELIGAFSPS